MTTCKASIAEETANEAAAELTKRNSAVVGGKIDTNEFFTLYVDEKEDSGFVTAKETFEKNFRAEYGSLTLSWQGVPRISKQSYIITPKPTQNADHIGILVLSQPTASSVQPGQALMWPGDKPQQIHIKENMIFVYFMAKSNT